jgi:voltage-gated potassium channel
MTVDLENRVLVRHTVLAALFLLTVLAGGTIGYVLIEGWSAFDGFYMTVITLATIGYGETHELSVPGRVFTLGLIFLGVGYLGYAFGGVVRFFATGGLVEFRRRQRMEKLRKSLRDHVIICGGGRLGEAIIESLRTRHTHLVLVDRSAAVLQRWSDDQQIVTVCGDATDDEVLREAGVEHASVLVAALNDDASNVFLVLGARVLNPGLKVFGKADDPSTVRKLERAGCDHPFSPGMVTGHRIAAQILRPTVMQILSLSERDGSVELSVEELPAHSLGVSSPTLMRDLPIWGKAELLVLAVHRQGGQLVFPPRADTSVEATDRIVILGRAVTVATARAR